MHFFVMKLRWVETWELFLTDNTIVQCVADFAPWTSVICYDSSAASQDNNSYSCSRECPSYMSSCGEQYGSLIQIFHIFHSWPQGFDLLQAFRFNWVSSTTTMEWAERFFTFDKKNCQMSRRIWRNECLSGCAELQGVFMRILNTSKNYKTIQIHYLQHRAKSSRFWKIKLCVRLSTVFDGCSFGSCHWHLIFEDTNPKDFIAFLSMLLRRYLDSWIVINSLFCLRRNILLLMVLLFLVYMSPWSTCHSLTNKTKKQLHFSNLMKRLSTITNTTSNKLTNMLLLSPMWKKICQLMLGEHSSSLYQIVDILLSGQGSFVRETSDFLGNFWFCKNSSV